MKEKRGIRPQILPILMDNLYRALWGEDTLTETDVRVHIAAIKPSVGEYEYPKGLSGSEVEEGYGSGCWVVGDAKPKK